MNQEVSETIRAVAASVLFVAGATLLALGLLSYMRPTTGCPALGAKLTFGAAPAVLLFVSAQVQPYKVLRLPIRLAALAAGLAALATLAADRCLL